LITLQSEGSSRKIPYICPRMEIQVLKSKIHRARVTQAELHYVGSITLDEELMEASNLIENELVQVLNIANGERFETYVIKGQRGSGTVCLNGPAARKVQVGDLIIVVSFAVMDFEEAKKFKPSLVFPDADNRLIKS
jgi:aspartate 1-decarboxylase